MDRTAATHSNHDELLIVRLFGGDLDDHERAIALDLLGECDDCATLFADLRATADATAALPIPARPRDFTLTEADATRLRKARRGLGFLSLLRRTRAIGGSLVALGLVGLVATASLSTLSGTATSGADAHSYNAAALSVATAGPVALGAVDSASGSVEPRAVSAPAGGTDLTVTKAASPLPVPASQVADAASSAAPAAPLPSDVRFGPAAGGASDGIGIAAVGSSPGLDARLVWFGGFGLLFLAGLGVLIVPLFRRRRTR